MSYAHNLNHIPDSLFSGIPFVSWEFHTSHLNQNLMKKLFTLLTFSIAMSFVASAQSTNSCNCAYGLRTPDNAYYGGFEAGDSNIAVTTGHSDLYNGLPRNGSYQVVQNVSQLGGGGYLNIRPHSGNSFLAAHTSNNVSDRVWHSTIYVSPGSTYNFCAWVTLLKNLGQGANYILGVYANGVQLGTGRVTFNWSEICGSFTVPANVYTVEFSLRDPKKGLFFVATDDICISGGPTGVRLANPNPKSKPVLPAEMSVYPNPAANGVTLSIFSEKKAAAQVMVSDMNGKIVLRRIVQLNAGENFTKLDELSRSADGIYNVQVNIEGRMISQKLVLGK